MNARRLPELAAAALLEFAAGCTSPQAGAAAAVTGKASSTGAPPDRGTAPPTGTAATPAAALVVALGEGPEDVAVVAPGGGPPQPLRLGPRSYPGPVRPGSEALTLLQVDDGGATSARLSLYSPRSGGRTPLARLPGPVHLGNWSRLGDRLVLTARPDGGPPQVVGLEVGGAPGATAAPRVLTAVRTGAYDPSLAPDGTWVAFACADRGDLDVFRVSWDAPGDSVPLASGPGDQSVPRVSPDGTRLVYAERTAGRTGVRLATRDGRRPRNLLAGLPGDAEVRDMEWNPDARRLAVSLTGGTVAVWVVDTASGAVLYRTSPRARARHPTWSPDGTWIAFGTGPAGAGRVVVRNPSASKAPGRPWTPPHYDAWLPRFLPVLPPPKAAASSFGVAGSNPSPVRHADARAPEGGSARRPRRRSAAAGGTPPSRSTSG